VLKRVTLEIILPDSLVDTLRGPARASLPFESESSGAEIAPRRVNSAKVVFVRKTLIASCLKPLGTSPVSQRAKISVL
jgi:hypothetical protein